MSEVAPSAVERRLRPSAVERRLRLIDDVRLALGEVYSGAETLDAEALLDQLERRGLRVVRS